MCGEQRTTGSMYSGILENTVLLITFIIDLARTKLSAPFRHKKKSLTNKSL